MLNCKLCHRGPTPPPGGCFCDYGKVKLDGIDNEQGQMEPKSIMQIEHDNFSEEQHFTKTLS